MDLSSRIGAWMRYRNVSQRQIAEKLDVVPSTVSMWCTGDSSPSLKHLDGLIVFLAGDHATFYGRVPKRKAA